MDTHGFRQYRLSQIILDVFLSIIFFCLVPLIKVVGFLSGLICRNRRSQIISESSETNSLSRDLLIGTRWGLLKYHWHERRYSLIPISILLSILWHFFGRDKITGTISESVYEMN